MSKTPANVMTIVILSYRHEYAHHCGRGCHCLHASGSSDLEFSVADTEGEAARYIAGRIHEDPKAMYGHLLFDRWEDFVTHSERGDVPEGEAEESIVVPHTIDWNNYDLDEDYEALGKRKDLQCSNIRRLVAAKLKELSEKEKRKEAEERNRRQEQEAQQRLEQERIQYEKLQKKFGD